MSSLGDSQPTDAQLVQALSVLAVDLSLEEIEDELSQFNIFEVLRITHYENRHSDFLSWLLDPSANHGLGDTVLRRFLHRAVQESETETIIGNLTIASLDFRSATVRREVSKAEDRRRTDIEIIDDKNDLVILIENKVHATEGTNQLQHYLERLRREFPRHHQLPFYLTIEGNPPSHKDYISANYSQITEVLEEIQNHRKGSISRDVSLAIRHYIQMLRRNIVADSELADKARLFYAKHKQALDYIFDIRPDPQLELRDELVKQLRKNQRLELDYHLKRFVRFLDRKWDSYSVLKQGEPGWTGSRRMLLLEIVNDPLKASLILTLGPGPEPVRRKIFDELASGIGLPIKKKSYSSKTTVLGRLDLCSWKDEDEEPSSRAKQVIAKLDSVLNDVLPKIAERLQISLMDAR